MPSFKFSKLVRDHIVEQQIASGTEPHYRVLDTAAHKRALMHKVIEEVQEVDEASLEKVAGELADVQQALDDLRDLYGISAGEVAVAQQVKLEQSGGFSQGIYIDEFAVDEGDPWVEHFRAHPDKYPEV